MMEKEIGKLTPESLPSSPVKVPFYLLLSLHPLRNVSVAGYTMVAKTKAVASAAGELQMVAYRMSESSVPLSR